MNKKRFMIIRMCIYTISIVLTILVAVGKIKTSCFFQDNFGLTCPACGLTRATISLLNLDFKGAVSYNTYYVLVLMPLVIGLVANDVYVFIKRFIMKKKSISFIEIIFGERSME